MCLQEDNRFSVKLDWSGDNRSGTAVPLAHAVDSATFWVLGPFNSRVPVTIVNGCDVNGHFWFQTGSLPELEIEITVVDTQTGQVVEYISGSQSPAIIDRSAFNTCGPGPGPG